MKLCKLTVLVLMFTQTVSNALSLDENGRDEKDPFYCRKLPLKTDTDYATLGDKFKCCAGEKSQDCPHYNKYKKLCKKWTETATE